jgi:uncharacterized membrane protein
MTQKLNYPDTLTGRLAGMGEPRQQGQQAHPQSVLMSQQTNVAGEERAVSVAAGSIVALMGLSRGSLPGVAIAGVGAAMLYRGLTGHCHLYSALGVNSAAQQSPERSIVRRGIHVTQTFLVSKPREELYAYWRDFTRLPRIMTHLESVTAIDDRRSHWVARAPSIAGGSIEWDAEVTTDEPDERIGWRSLPGSSVDTVGEVCFTQGLGDRGTEVRVTMDYVPPAGRLGHWVAKLFGEAADRQIREDLRHFKQIMEAGEIPSTRGQPRGTCTGQGGKYQEK